MTRFAVLFADSRIVVMTHAKSDDQPPVPRTGNYEVVQIGLEETCRIGMQQQQDGSFIWLPQVA